MQDILIISACIALGMVCGVLQKRNRPFLHLADRISLYAVYILLFVLGVRLGVNEALLRQLPLLGGQALCIAFLCVAASVGLLFLAQPHIAPLPLHVDNEKEPAKGAKLLPLKGSICIMACFVGGIALAALGLTPPWLANSDLAAYALYLLIFAVGIGLGADLRAFRVLRDLHIKILAVPLLIVAGSALGSAAAALLLPGLSTGEALCVGMGLGYYSLSSILIENAGQSALASVALLANILREVMAILAAPIIARHCGPLGVVGAAGATAMDTTLPIIARFSGEYAAVIAVFSGMSLTLLVPFLVTTALHL
ncbi:lysine exporter LysO family protein [Desulfovibrio sp. OttesenSCG-928-F20]|nr:lysine exporter LysO family protein [Desulfovibrio sp. OttesenSCG-928-F20]